ncbi:MAG: hypothetical protein WC974_01760 [Thermoplasmata archaeon]
MNCSSCGKDFGRFYWLYLRWHKQSNTYRCGRCYFADGSHTDESEKDSFARINRAMPLSLPSNWLVVLLIIAFILPVAAGLFIEGKKAEMWSTLEPSNISDLKEGGLVKVYGTINMTTGWQMSGSEHVSTDKHGTKSYSFSPEFKAFYLQNGTDVIVVTRGNPITIYKSKNPILTEHNVVGWVYLPDDYVWVIGTVKADTSGNLAIAANAVAPYDKVLVNDAAWNMLFSYILSTIVILPFAILSLRGGSRQIRHNGKILGGTTYRQTEGEFSGIGAITIIENRRRLLYLRLVLVISTIFAGIGAYLFLAYSSQILYNAFIIGFSLEVFVVASLMLFVYFYIWQSSTQVEFYDDGVRFRYADDRLNMSLMTLLRWNDIESIRLVRHGKSSSWIIRFKDGSEKNFANIPGNIRKDIISELERRKATAMPAASWR